MQDRASTHRHPISAGAPAKTCLSVTLHLQVKGHERSCRGWKLIEAKMPAKWTTVPPNEPITYASFEIMNAVMNIMSSEYNNSEFSCWTLASQYLCISSVGFAYWDKDGQGIWTSTGPQSLRTSQLTFRAQHICWQTQNTSRHRPLRAEPLNLVLYLCMLTVCPSSAGC